MGLQSPCAVFRFSLYDPHLSLMLRTESGGWIWLLIFPSWHPYDPQVGLGMTWWISARRLKRFWRHPCEMKVFLYTHNSWMEITVNFGSQRSPFDVECWRKLPQQLPKNEFVSMWQIGNRCVTCLVTWYQAWDWMTSLTWHISSYMQSLKYAH